MTKKASNGHHVAHDGVAGLAFANGSMASYPSAEGEIRKNLLEADLVYGPAAGLALLLGADPGVPVNPALLPEASDVHDPATSFSS